MATITAYDVADYRHRAMRAVVLSLACGVAAAACLTGLASRTASDDDGPLPRTDVLPSYAAPNPRTPSSAIHLDRSGRIQIGKASFYATGDAGRTMADGTPMRMYSDNAASRTLPLGTTARITNLHTGQSTTVTIRDRGPYVKGRIVDLSPVTARRIGIDKTNGVAKVEIVPIAVPMPDGSVRLASSRR